MKKLNQKPKDIQDVWKSIMAGMVAQILVKVIDEANIEKFENPQDYWDNRMEIIDQFIGERIERGEKLD